MIIIGEEGRRYFILDESLSSNCEQGIFFFFFSSIPYSEILLLVKFCSVNMLIQREKNWLWIGVKNG